MSNRLPTTQNKTENWRSQSYLFGLVGGTVFGLLCAYFYTRAAEDESAKKGSLQPDRIQTRDVIGLGLAGLAILRQIAELGRTPDKK